MRRKRTEYIYLDDSEPIKDFVDLTRDDEEEVLECIVCYSESKDKLSCCNKVLCMSCRESMRKHTTQLLCPNCRRVNTQEIGEWPSVESSFAERYAPMARHRMALDYMRLFSSFDDSLNRVDQRLNVVNRRVRRMLSSIYDD